MTKTKKTQVRIAHAMGIIAPFILEVLGGGTIAWTGTAWTPGDATARFPERSDARAFAALHHLVIVDE